MQQLLDASDALTRSNPSGRLVPAVAGCPDCNTGRMVAGPLLGRCPDCGGADTVFTDGQRENWLALP